LSREWFGELAHGEVPRIAERTVGKSITESVTGTVRASRQLRTCKFTLKFSRRISNKWFSERLREIAAAAHSKSRKVGQNQAGS
jgi:hypothetical protein